jgi:hypothetical protein
MCTDGASGIYLAWEAEMSVTDSDIFVQRLDGDGQVPTGWPSGGRNFVPTGTEQSWPDIIPDGSGGVIVAWQDFRSTTDEDVYALRVTGSGTVYPGWSTNGVAVSARAGSDQRVPLLVGDGTGGAVVTWTDYRHPAPFVFCTRVTATGDVVWVPENDGMRLCLSTASQQHPQVCSDGEGGLIAVWEDSRGSDTDLYAQHVTFDGRYAYSLHFGKPICTATGDITEASIVDVAPQRAIVAFADYRNSATTWIDLYAQNIDGLANLTPITSHPGWSSPLVPRNTTGGTPSNCVVTPTLDGDVNSTYLNVLQALQVNPVSDIHGLLRVDDEDDLWGLIFPDGYTPGLIAATDIGPVTIRGGRHTLIHFTDRFDGIPESNEMDNVYAEQYVWSPTELLKETPLVRNRPPPRGEFELPNCDGLEINRPQAAAWVVGIAPLHPEDDYDLWGFDDYVGSTSGFSNFYGASVVGGNGTDFMVGHWENTPTTFYPGVVRFQANVGESYTADQSDAALRQGNQGGIYENQLMTYGRIVDVYELALTGGQTYYFALHRLSGEPDIAFELFPGASGWVYARGGSNDGGSGPMSPGTDTLTYTTTESGYHPLVVYRTNGTAATELEVRYTLQWGPEPVVDVPEGEIPDFRLAFHGVVPNPMTASGRVLFTLAERGNVRLAVYDLRGRRVGSVLDGTREPGPQSIVWSGQGLSGRRLGAGIYWLRLETAGQVFTKRAVLLN